MSALHGSSVLNSDELQYRTRSYQSEMLEESLRANIIVAMDTGSAPFTLLCSLVAVLRIMAELDRCPPEKLVWFLAPTVALCTQQHGVISFQLPAARTRLLIGSDNVDRWSEQRIWDAALKDVQIVVSTHAVLADALGHGFVNISRLALLIFDEAHHCARGHPANRIMRDFYHPEKEGGEPIPHILGLTASPIMRSKISELQTIEANLDSTSITPRLHRQELLMYVHRPIMIKLEYLQHDSTSNVRSSGLLQNLALIWHQASMAADLSQEQSEPRLRTNWEQKRKLFNVENFCADQLKGFHAKSQHIFEQLGLWAADYFIIESIKKFRKTVEIEREIFSGWENGAKTHLMRMLNKLNITDSPLSGPSDVSYKFERLISFLCDNQHRDFSGLIFVQQRATVSVMSALLSIHPATRNHFQCAPYIGLSNSANKKQNIGELLDPRAMCDTLDDFRNRRKNLIITTDVLEEGIDITACHMVICFDNIPNLKSFIQRRGRARQENSTYAIMLSTNDTSVKLNSFERLEEEMLQTYQNELRLQKNVFALESIQEDVPDVFYVEATKARLTANDAIAHLHHFCNTLPRSPYVDLRPTFTFSEDKETHLLNATVALPNYLTSSVRRKIGLRWWQTEHAAMKDAAFQAYVALYKAGLLTDNLLPFPRQPIENLEAYDELPSIVEVQAQLNPWAESGTTWAQANLYQTPLSIRQQNDKKDGELRIVLRTPFPLPLVYPFALYRDNETILNVRMEDSKRTSLFDPENVTLMREITHVLLRSTHSDYITDTPKDFVFLVTPEISQGDLGSWLEENRGRRLALQEFNLHREFRSLGLVRTSLFNGIPHIFRNWHMATEFEEIEVRVECRQLPRRRNFLHRGTLAITTVDSAHQVDENSHKVLLFPANTCTIDLLPYSAAKCGLFIPSIMHHIEMVMVATRLQQTILKNLPFNDIRHVLEAITASSAQSTVNYQRYEFIGDSILKFVVSSQLFVNHKDWHEGYLSECRASLVSNACLANAALNAGLDKFILTKPFTAKHWSPPLISTVENYSAGRRTISSKTLADAVEALIGASYIDGGISVATTCIQTFLPDFCVQSPELLFSTRTSHANGTNSAINAKAETIIGYRFQDITLLVESLTHPSCERDIVTESYQRLEFLGDAILDMIVVSILSKRTPYRSHGDMTMIKAALVNADLLAFFCMESSIKYDVVNIQQKNSREFCEMHSSDEMGLWTFMRHHSQEIMAAQQACLNRHRGLRVEIGYLMSHGKSYPWSLLAKLNADKFFSDIIESIIGAIFVDSRGSLAACRSFAERIGLLPYLLRVLEEEIDVVHPKTALGHVSGSRKVEYIIEGEGGASNLYRCLIRIDSVDIVSVGECLTKNEAIVRTADTAVRLISETKSE